VTRLVGWLTRQRLRGAAAWLPTIVRVVTGVLFMSISTGKFLDHAQESVDFDRYGVPAPEVTTSLVGTLELIGGALLVLGLLTRPTALLLAANLVGAIATAGRVEGGSFNLGVAPAMLVAMLFLVWAGPGRLALDARAFSRAGRERRPPTASSRA
jgi:putative oxidoreductase